MTQMIVINCSLVEIGGKRFEGRFGKRFEQMESKSYLHTYICRRPAMMQLGKNEINVIRPQTASTQASAAAICDDQASTHHAPAPGNPPPDGDGIIFFRPSQESPNPHSNSQTSQRFNLCGQSDKTADRVIHRLNKG